MKPELMGQSVYNLWRPLCDFLWDLPAVGTRLDRNPNKQALMLHTTAGSMDAFSQLRFPPFRYL